MILVRGWQLCEVQDQIAVHLSACTNVCKVFQCFNDHEKTALQLGVVLVPGFILLASRNGIISN